MKKETNMNNEVTLDTPSFNQGIEAAIDGLSFSDNPYREGTLCSDSWEEGWLFQNDEKAHDLFG
jgi:hypothetical protein